ncbi:dolichyl-phosphate beta-glucosyltransferase [Sporothrix bragantina]|uniref:dolichyl-phosphate beta-glucosyltransferase n=1 Tax=Sporothrix bragantina TaxID=671064 RepID=A0ABP0D2G8_9PEZI
MASPIDLASSLLAAIFSIPIPLLLTGVTVFGAIACVAGYLLLRHIAPKPRLPFPSEKTYQTSAPASGSGKDSTTIVSRQLPCWYDKWLAERHLAEAAAKNQGNGTSSNSNINGIAYSLSAIEPAEVGLTVVVPAYNEALRILPALEEMVDYCDKRFGRPKPALEKTTATTMAESVNDKEQTYRPMTPKRKKAPSAAVMYDFPANRKHSTGGNSTADDDEAQLPSGYEILIVNDASSDNTVEVVLDFARERGLHDVVRVITLAKNRGKGGGVTHGLRHARGAYVVFADADGASRFGDLDKLIEGCDVVVDASDRGVAIGSRAHLVGSAAVVQRSALRNFLMKSFHFVLTILTPPATSRIGDTQCGFKLFSRAALPHIVPYMHTEGWIFDIEMLMLAESAPATPVVAHDGSFIGTSAGIKVAEVPVGWHEVDGSKMNLVQDSIRMAIGLTVLRASWMLGVYRRRLT